MTYEYALVHLKFTIPVALFLTAASYPILNRLSLYKAGTLILIAFLATLPWDSYLIRHGIWSYPPGAIIGPGLFDVPAEELFFFVVQTYITSLLYVILSKPVLHVQYLTRGPPRWISQARLALQLFLGASTIYGALLVRLGGQRTYLGLILIWASPFALLTGSLGGEFLLSLPLSSTLVPILLPTLYLWLVDELALGRGTWAIESGTKLGVCLWGSLDIEEAVFFLATNTLIVLGLVAFDNAVAVIDALPNLFPQSLECPPPLMLVWALTVSRSRYDMDRIEGICEAVTRLQKKSRSFFLASSAFSGRLRVDLVLLYSFCRMADDFVDNARSETETKDWIEKLTKFLDMSYRFQGASSAKRREALLCIKQNFPTHAQSALVQLPVNLLPQKPLYDLLEGFKMDASFHSASAVNQEKGLFPIRDQSTLERYAACVAGTAGELCLALISHHSGLCDSPGGSGSARKDELSAAAREMGVALQLINIARDITVDAAIGRVYLPTSWLEEEGLSPDSVLTRPEGDPALKSLRGRLLRRAFELYGQARPAMERLPPSARRPMIAAVESYMEIGRVLAEVSSGREEGEGGGGGGGGSGKRGCGGFRLQSGRATVPRLRRLRVVYKAMVGA